MDKLDIIFQKQSEFQERVGNEPMFNIQFVKDMILATIDELTEALRETPWKPWKKQQEWNMEKFREELVDVLHFFVNLCLAGNMTSDELFNMYIEKNKVNHERQDDGY